MRRLTTLFVLCAWLLASGAHWDLAQGFAWTRMLVTYSRTMPVAEAVRLTFQPDNLCGVCEFVAEARTRADAGDAASPLAPTDSPTKGKLLLAPAPEPLFVYRIVPSPTWREEHFRPDACARPAPPVEPPRAA